MLLDNYQGRIIIAQPKCDSHFFKESCVLVARHTAKGAWGVALNKPAVSLNCDLKDVFEHIGIENTMNVNAPLYLGGPVHTNQVCLVHSNDWASNSTVEITNDISITMDISVLTALVAGQGPSKFKAFCGVSGWGPSQLEGEMKGEAPWTMKNRWLTVAATEDKVFDLDDREAWSTLLSEAVSLEVKEIF